MLYLSPCVEGTVRDHIASRCWLQRRPLRTFDSGTNPRDVTVTPTVAASVSIVTGSIRPDIREPAEVVSDSCEAVERLGDAQRCRDRSGETPKRAMRS